MALRKVFMLLFISSTKGSLTGYFSLPHKVVCSRIWNTPVSSEGRVLKAMAKSLFRLPLSIQQTSPPVFSWRISTMVPPISDPERQRVIRNPQRISLTFSIERLLI